MGETPILQRIVTTVIVPFLSNIDWEYSHTLIEDTRPFCLFQRTSTIREFFFDPTH